MPGRLLDGLAPRRPELRAFVGNEVLGLAVLPDRPVERFLEIDGTGWGFEEGESHALPGKMIHNQEDPPAERPTLG